MKLVYIAGPYRADSEWQVVQNIRRAEDLAIRVWQAGAACICPHKNTAMFGGVVDVDVILKGDLEILMRCDAVICLPSWGSSLGARGEVSLAEELGLPVFEYLNGLVSWLKEPAKAP